MHFLGETQVGLARNEANAQAESEGRDRGSGSRGSGVIQGFVLLSGVYDMCSETRRDLYCSLRCPKSHGLGRVGRGRPVERIPKEPQGKKSRATWNEGCRPPVQGCRPPVPTRTCLQFSLSMEFSSLTS